MKQVGGHSDASEESSDRALDELLSRATWPASDDAARQLGARWKSISPASRQRRLVIVIVPLAAAASLALGAVLVGQLIFKSRGITESPVTVAAPSPQVDVRPIIHSSPYAGRPLSRREELLLRLASMPRPAVEARPAGEVLLRRVTSDAVWAPRNGGPKFRLAHHVRVAEDLLLEQLATNRQPERRVEDARLLASIASERGLPMLMALHRDADTREAALGGILRLADAATLAMLARQSTVSGEREILLAAMLRRPPQPAVRLLLPMIQDHSLSAAALRSLDSLNDESSVPAVRRGITAVLFDELGGPRVEDRLAAARALGRIDGPETAARLAEMANRDVSRREALAALIWCGGRSEVATAALNFARRSPHLASTVRSLELTLTDVSTSQRTLNSGSRS